MNDGDLCLKEASYRWLELYADVLPLDRADVHSLTMHHVLAVAETGNAYPPVGPDPLDDARLGSRRRHSGKTHGNR